VAYRNYSDDDKAVVLAFYDACGNAEMTSRECKVPVATVKLWIHNRDAPSAVSAESVAEKKTDLAGELKKLALAACGQSLKALGEATSAQAATVLGIAIDKSLLLEGKATVISDTVSSIEERDAKLLEIMKNANLRLSA